MYRINLQLFVEINREIWMDYNQKNLLKIKYCLSH